MQRVSTISMLLELDVRVCRLIYRVLHVKYIGLFLYSRKLESLSKLGNVASSYVPKLGNKCFGSNVSMRSRSLHLFFQNRDPEVAFLHGNNSKECILV